MGASTKAARNGRGGRSRRLYTWTVAAALLVVAGVAGSVFAAGAGGRNEANRSQKVLESDGAGVASTLELAIQHEQDAVLDAGGLLGGRLSQAKFLRWANAARVAERYPELSSVTVLTLVDDEDLPAFVARVEADPPSALGPDGTYAVVPAGTRPFYCLTAAGFERNPSITLPPGFDPCADRAPRDALLQSRDSGLGSYQPLRLADLTALKGQTPTGPTMLAIYTPIYRHGATPTTVAGRRTTFAGWVVTVADPNVLIERALADKPGRAVQLRYHQGDTDISFTSGTAPDDAESVAVDLHNGWTVTTSGGVDPGGIGHGDALLLLLAGVALSVLLGMLLFVLGTGRERAQRQLEQRTSQLHHQALHDALTGLPNRALVMDRIEQMLARERRHQVSGALLFLDLDDFKNVNDTLGHGAGDRLLVAVAARMSSTLRGVDTIGRMGGDEFVVLLEAESLEAGPELVAQRLLEVMRQPFELDDASTPLTVNISIGVAAGHRDSADELLRDADLALYQAKAAGKNCYEVFDPDMHTDVSRRTDLEFDLRSALARGQFRLVYQPIYELDGLTVVGVEALLRWDHPTLGPVGPDEFIPILEQTGQMRDVGCWVLHEACRQMSVWHARGDELSVSVNVSARQLDSDSINEDIADALRSSGLPATALIIEITETALMRNQEATARRLETIKELGVRIAVDDFGTGYSSLAYLQQFPVDSIKIDRMFTSGVTSSPESRALVRTLVQLGKDLGLSTLAEGVETTAEVVTLRNAEVDQAQGFLMARPLEPETLEAQILAVRREAVREVG